MTRIPRRCYGILPAGTSPTVPTIHFHQSGVVRRHAQRIMRGWTTSAHPGQNDALSRARGTLRYYLKMESRKVGWGDTTLVYDEKKDLFRFTDSRFAFSREHADWALLFSYTALLA
jgi:hypothetical protein